MENKPITKDIINEAMRIVSKDVMKPYCVRKGLVTMENKETTDKIPTNELKEILFKHIHPNPTDRMLKFYNLVDYSGVYEAMKEYALLHLTKQAEAIAEKALIEKITYKFHEDYSINKQSILQASEEYKQSVK